MNEYSSVEIVPLHGQQLKNDKPSSSILSFHRENDGKKFSLILKEGSTILLTIPLDESVEQLRSGLTGLVLSFPKQENRSYLLKFNTQEDLQRFKKQLLQAKFGQTLGEHGSSQFDRRTEESSAIQYFQFYGYLSQQQNMMQDYIRTSAYQRAILSNSTDFSGKVVLDVGAGSGILSFFAAQAGARKVYAVEASSMAQHAKTLVEQNHLSNRIQVIAGKIEEITVPEPVDIIISEPMGYMLYNERMLETYLHAKKWLKPNGKMFPTTGDLYVTPFTDEALYMEQVGKANFWYQQSFYGVDLTSLRDTALEEYFKQPIVDNFDIRLCLAKPIKYSVNFLTAHEEDLQKIHIPLTFQLNTTALIHGLAFWFDVSFQGSSAQIWLSTAPTQPLTHWYQVRCLFLKPLTVTQGHTVHGHATLHSNRKQSYDVEIFLQLDGTTISTKNVLDLKNPYFRYPSQPMQVPPGQHHESPTEQYWNSLSNEQPTATMTLNNNHVNPMVYSQQHCHVNNHLPSILDPMVGNPSNPLSSQIPSSNSQQFNLSNAASPNYFDHLTTQMANGFISFANSATTNLQSQQRNSSS